MAEKTEGLLSPYRVLDLSDEKGQFCGKLMGDMGADVIKIEPPGGDPCRSIGPFYHDEVDPEKSLYWFSLNTSKRGITLDIGKPRGADLFRQLVRSADFVIESFTPGYLDSIGLGYRELEQLNPKLIMVSITPFGQTGPYREFKGPDIVMWSLGAGPNMRSWDSHDRAPYRISKHPQTYFHAGTEAVVGAMAALYHLGASGEGQQVDVSIQECVSWHPVSDWDFNRRLPARGGAGPAIRTTHIWPCGDGFVMWRYAGGAGAVRQSVPLVQWMAKEDMADEWLREFNWANYGGAKLTQEIVDRIEEQTNRFFMAHTKLELMAGAIEYRLMLYPVSTAADLLASPQLAAREFWEDVEHPELATKIRYPGRWANNSKNPPGISRPAPQLGEHNREVYVDELGVSAPALTELAESGIV